MTNQTFCRFCQTELKLSLIDLGSQPLANSYLPRDFELTREDIYPLHVRVCQKCRLAQVEAATAPENIFSDYAYFSSYSASWVDHARHFTNMARIRFNLGGDSKIVEVASNDGYLLQHFIEQNIPVLGVEPAANVAKVAIERGVPTEIAFFGKETAQRLKQNGHSADMIVGNNVYAHVPDINDFTAGLALLLKAEGTISLEFPHLLQLMRYNQFDTIYHEHFSYLSLLAVERIFRAHGLRVYDVEELPTHGGSLRIFACHQGHSGYAETANLLKVRSDEAKAGLDADDAYKGFEKNVLGVRADLLAFLEKAKGDGFTVAGYGAAAKGNTLLNYCGIKTDLLPYVVDRSPHKQNRLLPGSHIPVESPAVLFDRRPDYVLILPWNLKEEISADLAGIAVWGGKFVIAIPNLQIFNPLQQASSAI